MVTNPSGGGEARTFGPGIAGQASLSTQVDKSGDFRSVSVTQGKGIPTQGSVLVSTIPESGMKTTGLVVNPTSGLCQRLAVLTIQGGRVCEFRNHPHRLEMMIGRYLSQKAKISLGGLKGHQWSQIEEMWQAIGQTVLINADYQPDLVDYELIGSIQKAKIWYLNTVLGQKDITSSISHMGKDMKKLSSWIQHRCMDNEENLRPTELTRFPGHKPGKYPQLFWMGGHLSHLKDLNGPMSDKKLAILCQLRTFGRALPCPTKFDVEKGLKETLEVLTTPRSVDPQILAVIPRAMAYLNHRLNFSSLTRSSHVSVTLSGSLNSRQEDGGMAADARKYLHMFLPDIRTFCMSTSSPFLDDRFFAVRNDGTDRPLHAQAFYDCYGNEILGPQKFTNHALVLHAYEVFFTKPEEFAGYRRIKRENPTKSNYFGPNTGKLLLWAASADLMNHGSFYPEPQGFVKTPCGALLPIWWNRQPVSYQPKTPLECRVVSLGEPGFKVRPLTAGHTGMILIQKTMRQMVQTLLEKDGRCRVGLAVTNKLWSFLKFWGKKDLPDGVFSQNSDYKSATDYIPLDMIEAIWSSFTSFLPVDHPFRVYVALLWAPRKLLVSGKQYPGIGDCELNHVCGSFMGEPMSYMTLMLMNVLVEYIGFVYYETKAPLWSPLPESYGFANMDHFVVVGDDKIAIRTSKEMAEISRKVSIGLGFVMSDKDGDSRRLILLCEDHVLITKDDTKNVLVYVDAIKGRLLTNVSRGHADNRASIFGKGRMLANQLAYMDEGPKLHVLTCYANLFVRKYGKKFLQAQVPWFLPPNCGGIGLDIGTIPKWGNKYINYVLSILDIEDRALRYKALWDLRALSVRHAHGAEPSKDARDMAAKCLQTLREDLNDPFDTPGVIFSTKRIYSEMEKQGYIMAPWESYYSFDSIENFAGSLGLRPITKVIDQFERIDTFQKMLEGPIKVKRKSLHSWVKRADRVFSKLNLRDEEMSPRYKSINDLEKLVERSDEGWINASLISDFLKYGPALKLDLFERRASLNLRQRMEQLSQRLKLAS
uniref:RNA-dependent RNA polymerase n=1 Tax=Plasmopara viticola lesion associated narnavirus 28 TaxID=2719512 RepID=A0A6G9RTF6_9VIRU|nr:RNA-dependent RNA polymerase [Plasmopara viticola lesion associated narnavirus 28]